MNDHWLIIQPMLPVWLMVLLLVIMTGFFLWKEKQRKIKYLSLRVSASSVLVLSIAGVLLRPALRETRETDGYVLLTEGFRKEQADSLLATRPALNVIKTHEASSYARAQTVTNAEVTMLLSKIRFVLGNGLPSYALNPNSNFVLLPPATVAGITKLILPHEIKTTQPATVKGFFHTESEAKLVLYSAAQAEDSVTLKQSGEFSLSFIPREPGLFMYTITIEQDGKKTSEPLPVEVLPAEMLKIFMVQKFPTAEMRHLKNFLTEQGHALSVRWQVSKSNYRYEYANQLQTKAEFRKEFLQTVDILIADAEAVAGLSNAELRVLDMAVKEGLGLLVLEDSDQKQLPLLNVVLSKTTSDTVYVSQLNATWPAVRLQATDTRLKPVTQSTGRMLSGYGAWGTGKIGFQFLQETYALQMQGKTKEYAQLWSPLIEQLTRIKAEPFFIKVQNAFPFYEDEPLQITVLSVDEEPVLREENTRLALRENVVIDNYWHGTTWAGNAGWYSLTVQDSITKNFYVAPDNSWKSLRVYNQVQRNKLMFTEFTSTDTSSEFLYRPVALLIFFIIFLIAGTVLWLVPKL